MRFRLAKESGKRRSIADIEAEAAAEIEQRVALGKPPPEDFAPVEKRLAELEAAGQLERPAVSALSVTTSTNGHAVTAERTAVEVEAQAPIAKPAKGPEPAVAAPAPVKLNIRKPARKPATGGRKPATASKPATKPAGRKPVAGAKPAARRSARKSSA